MNIFILDGTKMTDRETCHHYIARIMHFPDYYGNNLDALYDCLGEYGPQSTVIIMNKTILLMYLDDYGEKLLETFRDAANEPASFNLIIND
ncbi:MAG: barstar family protein [Erysipelotrichaceae bacterium]|nr:barstar family protein [Erysipelotrichaceae bacterium]